MTTKGIPVSNPTINDSSLIKALIIIMLSCASLALCLMYFANKIIIPSYQPVWHGMKLPFITELAILYIGSIAFTSICMSFIASALLILNKGARTTIVSMALLIANILTIALLAYAYMLPLFQSSFAIYGGKLY